MRNSESKLQRERQLRDNERELLELFSNLDREYPNILIVVEGKHDEEILRDLGITTEIIRIHRGKNISATSEIIATKCQTGKSVLLLTDFDSEGVRLCKKLEHALEIQHVTVLRELRSQIGMLMANLRCIEELVVILRKIERLSIRHRNIGD